MTSVDNAANPASTANAGWARLLLPVGFVRTTALRPYLAEPGGQLVDEHADASGEVGRVVVWDDPAGHVAALTTSTGLSPAALRRAGAALAAEYGDPLVVLHHVADPAGGMRIDQVNPASGRRRPLWPLPTDDPRARDRAEHFLGALYELADYDPTDPTVLGADPAADPDTTEDR